jgi:hypothetical protein
MSNKVVYAIYDDILMDAVKQTRAAHHHIEFYSISVHGWIKQWALRLPD